MKFQERFIRRLRKIFGLRTPQVVVRISSDASEAQVAQAIALLQGSIPAHHDIIIVYGNITFNYL